MTEVLGLDHFSLAPKGPTLSLSVNRGQTLAVVGRAGSGKSRTLRVFAGQERPAQGEVRLSAESALCESELSRRARPQTLARRAGHPGQAARATSVLMAAHLWEVRDIPVQDLSPSQARACELLEPMASDAGLVLIDGQLDGLDPWTLRSFLEYLKDQRLEGRSFVIATHRPDLLAQADAILVLKEGQVRFAGSPTDLLRSGPQFHFEVATENQPAVRSLVSPFEVSVEETESGLHMEAEEGQALAARLLLEGYGDVRFVVSRPPTLEEALLALL